MTGKEHVLKDASKKQMVTKKLSTFRQYNNKEIDERLFEIKGKVALYFLPKHFIPLLIIKERQTR